MNVRANRNMLELLGGNPEYFKMPTLDLPGALMEKASMPITEVNGCMVPASTPPPTWVDDETGTECFWTKFHVEDFVSGASREELARLALDYVWPLQSGLRASRLSGAFRMIVSVSISETTTAKPVCTVRFHRLRPRQNWLATDIEAYRSEAILVCDFTIG